MSGSPDKFPLTEAEQAIYSRAQALGIELPTPTPEERRDLIESFLDGQSLNFVKLFTELLDDIGTRRGSRPNSPLRALRDAFTAEGTNLVRARAENAETTDDLQNQLWAAWKFVAALKLFDVVGLDLDQSENKLEALQYKMKLQLTGQQINWAEEITEFFRKIGRRPPGQNPPNQK